MAGARCPRYRCLCPDQIGHLASPALAHDSNKGEKMVSEFEKKAQDTFSAERKEDVFVLILAAIAVVLVKLGVIGPSFVKSLFF